ncbi:MAG: S41 family peptidase [Planctomycetota bacterium]|jgi:carboxyl-terminal processing protease
MRKRTALLLVLSGLLAAAAWSWPARRVSPGAAEPAAPAAEPPVKPKPKPKPRTKRRIVEAEALARVKRVILDHYVLPVDEKKLFYGTMRGMVRELDPHSQFLTPEEYADINASTTGEFGGLGIEVTIRDGWLTVVTPLVGTPAFKAGILPGDRIVRINGEPSDRLSLEEAVHKMRGRPGTKIVLGIARKGESKLLDVTIVRQTIKVDSVRIPHFTDKKNGIAYVNLTNFQADTAEELARTVKDLEKKGMRALVIDLRANGGGRMDAAIKVANLFLKEGVIVSTRGRPGARRENVVYRAKRPGTRPDYPLAVLINQSSASASEIVAGALRDNHRAILVGEKSFGKASVQTLQRVRIGHEIAGLKLTTAHYHTPSGQMIHKKGIEPDIRVVMDVKVLVEVFKQQHERWVKLNAPPKQKAPGKEDASGKSDEPDKPDEPKESEESSDDGKPEKPGKSEKSEKPEKPAEVVDTQLKAAVRALRAILIDRRRGQGAARPAPGKRPEKMPLPDVEPGGVEP